MNRGMLAKTLCEVVPTTLLIGAALTVVEIALSYVIPSFAESPMQQWLNVPFVKSILKGLLGTEVGDMFGPNMMSSIAWVHPVVLSLVWAHVTILCTRVPAGEVDRGTIDVLLSLPVSRWRLYLGETIVWLAGGVVIIGLAWLGKSIGDRIIENALPTQRRPLIIILTNLCCLYLATGGLAWLISALSDRRGRAIAVIFAVVLASFLLNFLAEFGGVAERVVFLSVLHYYRPLAVMRESAWPLSDMLVLAGVGVVTWLAGAIVFARRDIRTI